MLSQQYKRGTITESLAQIREEEEIAGEIQDVLSQDIEMITEQNPILETTFNVDVNKDKRTEKAKGVEKLLPYQSDNEDDYDDDGHGSTNTMGREEVKQSIEVKVVMGGPVTPLFQVRTEVPHQFLSFSQRRKKGYRSNYEFDKKRVLVGNEKNI